MESPVFQSYEIITIGICLVISAFFSAAETAITSLGSLKAKHAMDTKGKALRELSLWLNHPGRVLTTILIFNNVVNIFASALATEVATRYFESQAIGIATGVMTFLVLIFGEVIPKSFAKAQHERLAVPVMRVIYIAYLLTYPLVILLSEFARVVVRMLGGHRIDTPPITEEEIEYLVNVGERAGVLEESKKDMLASIFEFDETKVREILTPRPDIEWLTLESTLDEALQLAIETGFSRIPICSDQGIDDVVGILLIKDLLRVVRRNGDPTQKVFDIKDVMREPFFIPESKLIVDVFKDLKRSKNHIAIVIDEHGGTGGLVTLEDILEEIVGEIQDEYDVEEAAVLELEPGVFDIAGSVNIDEFLDIFDLDEKDVPESTEQEVDTIAGWITAIHGNLPAIGETMRIGPLAIEVIDVERNRVQRVRVARISEEAVEPDPILEPTNQEGQ